MHTACRNIYAALPVRVGGATRSVCGLAACRMQRCYRRFGGNDRPVDHRSRHAGAAFRAGIDQADRQGGQLTCPARADGPIPPIPDFQQTGPATGRIYYRRDRIVSGRGGCISGRRFSCPHRVIRPGASPGSCIPRSPRRTGRMSGPRYHRMASRSGRHVSAARRTSDDRHGAANDASVVQRD